jgi:hypothetical protein
VIRSCVAESFHFSKGTESRKHGNEIPGRVFVIPACMLVCEIEQNFSLA